ncbi:MAG: hypothetical protein K2X01_04630 [Cyanobacteria bacterium]|nr:hypothetical protein [Cyanobacteriota bacterium]
MPSRQLINKFLSAQWIVFSLMLTTANCTVLAAQDIRFQNISSAPFPSEILTQIKRENTIPFSTTEVKVKALPLAEKTQKKAWAVQLNNTNYCGSSGCLTLVYLAEGKDKKIWRKVFDANVQGLAVGKGEHKGVPNLVANGQHVWRFDGKQYNP